MRSTTIRPLKESHWNAWWALRLVALRDHPDMFGSDHDEAVATGEASAHDRFVTTSITGDNRVFGALLENGTLIGTCGVIRHHGAKTRHRMDIWGMYVSPAFRATGIGRRLLHAAIGHARRTDGVLQLHLTVSSHNTAAIASYSRLGFAVYGQEPRALRLPDRFVDEDLMVMMLDTPGAE